MIPLVVASERGTAQTGDVVTHCRGCRTTLLYGNNEQKVLESSAIAHESCLDVRDMTVLPAPEYRGAREIPRESAGTIR